MWAVWMIRAMIARGKAGRGAGTRRDCEYHEGAQGRGPEADDPHSGVGGPPQQDNQAGTGSQSQQKEEA
ncbi:hypothetical protein ISF9_055 [Microbacterium phage vB_MoxS-ISF9]|uniref:Uncharacterized protein n=1 Tax=Microbacterium phage vB_MoxS-ISF9 TaxID=1458670 RepID=W8NNL2_9CAUD|nr:hypothetical protein ISF9_055 [Microbacterium phage vB_MoxS-ISF9]AHL18525.1 hypothetical protein ISF9_055 [Microbacterium phage vB_MoxS-ISF9]